jgi:hypothetical protein
MSGAGGDVDMQPEQAGTAAAPPAPCRFCSVWFDSDVSFCPRCGLMRQDGPPAPAPPTYQPQGYQPPDYQPPGYQPPGYQPPTYQPAPPGYPGYPSYPASAGYQGDPPSAGRSSHGIWILAGVLAFVLLAGGAIFAASKIGSGRNQASTVTVPDGPGVVYRSTSGHFAGRFAETPDQHVLHGSLGNVSYSLVIASDQPAETIVESELLSQPLPTDEIPLNLTAGIKSIAIGGNMTLISDDAEQFQGRPAHAGYYRASDGTMLSALAFGYGSERIYVLLAPTGTAYDDLAASFVAVP